MSSVYESNFDVPIEEAYVIVNYVDGEEMVIISASEITEDVNVIKNGIAEYKILSYIDIGNSVKHVQVILYNTKEACDEYRESCQAFLHGSFSSSVKSLGSVESVTCQGPPMACQEKIDSIYHMVKKLTKSVEEMKEDLQDLKRQRYGSQTIAKVTCKEVVKKTLKEQFTEIINNQRSSRQWRQKISHSKFHDLPSKTMDIKRLLLEGPDEAEIFTRRLARILFGERQIQENLMGIDGKRLKGLKQGDRSQLFSTEEELKILEVLKNIDQDLFVSPEAFQHLVREPINQCGRDLNKNKNKRPAPPSFKPITDYFRAKQPTIRNQQDTDQPMMEPSTSGTSMPRTEISVTINRDTLQAANISSSEPQDLDSNTNVTAKNWFDRFYASIKKN